jgi:AcrR family transcriptional regulator
VSQVQFRRKEEEASGLRMRKKLRTHAAIVEAAFDLFEEHGFEETTVEQIAERADISTTTFFRYFPTKFDLVVCGGQAQLPQLAQVVVDRPKSESDFVAIREAILEIWVPEIDPGPTVCAAHAVLHSPTLRGIFENISRGWVTAVCDALAQRNGLDEPDRRCRLVARVALGTFGAAVESWVANKGEDDLGTLIQEEFALAMVSIGPADTA